MKQEECFYLTDGRCLSNLEDLAEVLGILTDEEFKHYVNEDKNDFAAWVEGVFGELELSRKFRSCQTREEMIHDLAEYFSNMSKRISTELESKHEVHHESNKMAHEYLQKRLHTVKKLKKHRAKTASNETFFSRLFSLANLKDLSDVLDDISDQEFHEHVNPEKNDFANWIEDVFQEYELAEKVRSLNSKEAIKKTVDEYLTSAPKKVTDEAKIESDKSLNNLEKDKTNVEEVFEGELGKKPPEEAKPSATLVDPLGTGLPPKKDEKGERSVLSRFFSNFR